MLHPSFSVRARRLAAATADRVLFRDLDLTLTAASRCGVVGPNGVGKSTLLRLLAGEVRPEVGTVERTPASTTVALVPQEPERSPVETVVELVAGRTGVAAANRELETAAEALGASTADSTECADRYDRALDRYTRLGCADFDERVAATASRIGLGAHLLDRPTEQLSGGEAARMSLLTVLVAQVDLLLLDEPTNDLDHAGLAMLESLVERSSAGMVIVSHDRVFLEQTVTTVVDLGADGSTATFDGGWLAYLEQRATARRHAEEAYHQYDDERERLVAQARRERTWSQQGVRRAKTSGEPDKNIRFGAWQGAQNSGQRAARSERQLERLTPVDKPWDGWDLRFSIAAADRAGAVVARLDEVTVQRGERTLGPWTLELAWGERLALAGPNGSGKTTLVEVLTGRRPPTSGSVHLGPSVVVGELRQQRLEAASTGDLLAWFLDHSQLTVAEGRSLLAKFGLGADHLARPPASLSTGERTRAELALFQARGVNLLILDEPTNHLDLEAIEQLEAALSTYAGTLLVVSHDRRFLEHVQVDRTRTVEPQPR